MHLTPNRKTGRGKGILLRGCGWVLGICFFLLATNLGRARESSVSETELKAAFLYNFTKFIEWPAGAFSSETAPIQIAVFGDDEFATRLGALLQDKKAHGRSFSVKTLTNPSEAVHCQIVFVPNSESKRFPQIVQVLKKLPVLTIGESPQLLEMGGMINFVFQDSQLRFEINPEAAEAAKLVISSKLLRLARNTKRGGDK